MLQQSAKRWSSSWLTSKGHAWDWSFRVSARFVAVRGLYGAKSETKTWWYVKHR